MPFGKLGCGLWLVRMEIAPQIRPKMNSTARHLYLWRMAHFWGVSARKSSLTASATQSAPDRATADEDRAPAGVSAECGSQAKRPPLEDTATKVRRPSSHYQSPRPRKPISWYPTSIPGTAMVSRGEIGFFISSIAESNGIFSSTANEDAGAVTNISHCHMAIVFCTVVGPLCVGLLVPQVKYLEACAEKDRRSVRSGVLGVWGVN